MIKLKDILFEDQRTSNDIGYHRGDGGIASDTTFKRMDAGRSTGHFGTGTYFCGSPDKITGREDRPLLKIDLSKLRFEVDYRNSEDSKYIKCEISVFVPGSKLSVGTLFFTYFKETNFILVGLIEVLDIPFTKPNPFTISDEEYKKLKEEDYEDYVIKSTGKGIANELYKKMLEIIQNDQVLSQADYIVSNDNSLQSLKAKDKIFGKAEMAGQGYKFFDVKTKIIELQKQNKELEEQSEFSSPQEKLKIDQQINNINDQILYLQEELKRMSINVDDIYNIVKPSVDGQLGSQLGGKPVDTFHRIPQRVPEQILPPNEKPKRIIEDTKQQRLEL